MKNQIKNMNNKNSKGFLFWLVIITGLFLLWQIMAEHKGQVEKLKYSDFIESVKSENIIRAYISGNVITGKAYKTEKNSQGKIVRASGDIEIFYKTAFPVNTPKLVETLEKHNVIIEAEELNRNEWIGIILSWLPFIVLIFFWVAIMKQQSGGKAFSFGKSKAKMFTGEKNKVTFKDVAGVEEPKEELQEIIEFLKDPKKFQRLGGKIPKGVLLVGPPGTGKTLLAKAIAGEADVPFFSISGSDFVELFVGVGASRVRDLFEEGKKHSPCLIFIDEIDAVGRQRGAGLGGGHDEREQTLNQLLVEMDGFGANDGVIIIAATNRPDILDSALLRPGRFDRRVVVSAPDVKGREEILRVHIKKVPVSRNVKLKVLARSTPGFTGADIANLVNEAALWASRKGKKKVDMKDFEYAKDKVLMGAERRSLIISDDEKKTTAYHEAGHALVAALNEHADPIHKVSIIPRGMALGVTQQLPLNDKYTYSREYLLSQISVLLGGRIAEEEFLGQMTTGAGNDLDRASTIARKMVCEWGMSELGPITFGKKNDMIFLGKDMMAHSEYSEETAGKIDKAILDIVNRSYDETKQVILDNRESLITIAEMLLEREAIGSEEMDKIIKGEPVDEEETEENTAADSLETEDAEEKE